MLLGIRKGLRKINESKESAAASYQAQGELERQQTNLRNPRPEAQYGHSERTNTQWEGIYYPRASIRRTFESHEQARQYYLAVSSLGHGFKFARSTHMTAWRGMYTNQLRISQTAFTPDVFADSASQSVCPRSLDRHFLKTCFSDAVPFPEPCHDFSFGTLKASLNSSGPGFWWRRFWSVAPGNGCSFFVRLPRRQRTLNKWAGIRWSSQVQTTTCRKAGIQIGFVSASLLRRPRDCSQECIRSSLGTRRSRAGSTRVA